MDWEDKQNAGDIKEDQVEIGNSLLGNMIIEENNFKEILLAYSQRLVDLYSNNESLQKEYREYLLWWLMNHQEAHDREQAALYESLDLIWSEAMEKGILKLKDSLKKEL